MKALRKKSIHAVNSGEHEEHGSLHKVLNVRDLTFFGIAAIIGAGSFSSIGSACFSGGPGVIFLFIICAVACGFTALCYAEFASRAPVSGSAYTYAYVSFGELFAWIIGWALLMEYSIGNIYVAFSWSGYFTNLFPGLPAWLTANYSESAKAFIDNTPGESLTAWNTAPQINGLRIIFDLPAVFINIVVTWLVYRGTKESRNVSNTMVIIKLVIIVLVIIVGAFYIDMDNWTPFMPNGFSGVMGGAASVFFAYIGFDAVSTLAEETKNPQRDLPRGMIYSLLICTVVFVILALVLTGMVSYARLNVSDPLAEVFASKNVKWMLYIVSIAAVVAMTSVILVFQMGQPRIWMSMSRDGLLPKKFAKIHPKYKTPGFSTIVTGLVVGIPLFFTNPKFVLDFTSIGTLFAFVLVCGGVLTLPHVEKRSSAEGGEERRGKFRLPYINAKFIFPLMVIASGALLFYVNPDFLSEKFNMTRSTASKDIPMLVFLLICVVMAVLSFLKNLSLIPVLGLVSCCYLLTGMEASNWVWFSVWLLIGLAVYFMYGYRKSKLHT